MVNDHKSSGAFDTQEQILLLCGVKHLLARRPTIATLWNRRETWLHRAEEHTAGYGPDTRKSKPCNNTAQCIELLNVSMTMTTDGRHTIESTRWDRSRDTVTLKLPVGQLIRRNVPYYLAHRVTNSKVAILFPDGSVQSCYECRLRNIWNLRALN